MKIKQVNLLTQIEEKCVCELEKLIAKSADLFQVKRGSFDGSSDKQGIYTAALSGKVSPVAMSVYEMEINVYFSVISTNAQNDPSRRDDIYPALTAILWHFSGLKIELKDGSVTLEPKGEFSQKNNDTSFLEYVCCFTTTVTIEKSEEEGDELLGVIAEYYAEPSEISAAKADYTEKITKSKSEIKNA